MSIYVKLGPKASSFFDPSQPDKKNNSLSNHKQVIVVDENSVLISKFLKSEGLVKVTRSDYDEYRKVEDARIKEEIDALSKKPNVNLNVNVGLEAKVDKLAASLEDLTTENAILKEQNAKLLEGVGLEAKVDTTKPVIGNEGDKQDPKKTGSK